MGAGFGVGACAAVSGHAHSPFGGIPFIILVTTCFPCFVGILGHFRERFLRLMVPVAPQWMQKITPRNCHRGWVSSDTFRAIWMVTGPGSAGGWGLEMGEAWVEGPEAEEAVGAEKLSAQLGGTSSCSKFSPIG